MADFDRESMLEMFSFEMSQLVEQLEQTIIQAESGYSMGEVNEIFRIMHTIKGSAAMMLFTTVSSMAHEIENLFYYLREENPVGVDYSLLTDFVLEGMDFIKGELEKIECGETADGDPTRNINRIKEFLRVLKGEAKPAAEHTSGGTGAVGAGPEKQDASALPNATVDGLKRYKARVVFEEGCEMENIRAYTLVHNLGDKIVDVSHIPEDIIDEESINPIRKDGFVLNFSSKLSYEELYDMLLSTIYLSQLELDEITPSALPMASDRQNAEEKQAEKEVIGSLENETMVPSHEAAPETETASAESKDLSSAVPSDAAQSAAKKAPAQQIISVNVSKLDKLLNLMGELVIAEAMVTQNPDLDELELVNFNKETLQLRKIINEVQTIVTSMRMVPLSTTFYKMQRPVRDMCKELSKDVELVIVGEETEVDKSIIEHISDPLMHIIRNSIDHGIELPNERRKKGKRPKGTVVLEAKDAGGDILIIIRDDGAGLNREKILSKAKNGGLLRKPESEYTDKEIFQFIFLPGFSTNEQVTNYSGRGVGMDVVTTNLEAVSGSVLVDSIKDEGSTFTLKIPQSLAIINGMIITIGGAKYTIPINNIKSSLKYNRNEYEMFTDPSGNEMITVRGEVFNVVRLYKFFDVPTEVTKPEDGIMILLENGNHSIYVFADELINEQKVVVKALPAYLKKVRGLSGCTLLGNGDISLIIDAAGFFE